MDWVVYQACTGLRPKIFLETAFVYVVSVYVCISRISVPVYYVIEAYKISFVGCFSICIKNHGSESQGQEEAACTHVFKPT